MKKVFLIFLLIISINLCLADTFSDCNIYGNCFKGSSQSIINFVNASNFSNQSNYWGNYFYADWDLNSFITNSVSNLVNYFTKTDILSFNYFNKTGDNYLYSSGNTIYSNISSFDDRYGHGQFVNYFYNTSSSDITNYFITNSTLPQITTQKNNIIPINLDNQILMSWVNSNTNLTFIPAGIVDFHIHATKTVSTLDTRLYFELYKRDSTGTETLLATSEESDNLVINTDTEISLHSVINDTILNVTDKLVVKVIADIGIGINPTVQIETEGQTASRLELPFTQGSISVNEVDPIFSSWLSSFSSKLVLNNQSNDFNGNNITGISYIKLNDFGNACDLTISGSICRNSTATYIVG